MEINNIIKNKLKIEAKGLIEKHTGNSVIKTRVVNANYIECNCSTEEIKEHTVFVFFKNSMVHFISDDTIFQSIIYRR